MSYTLNGLLIPAVTSIATAFTTGGAFIAWLNRKTRKDRLLEQEHKDTEIDQLKIDVTKDVVVLLRAELKHNSRQLTEKNDHIDYQDRIIGWLRRKIVRLETWIDQVRRENPHLSIPEIPSAEGDPMPTPSPRRTYED